MRTKTDIKMASEKLKISVKKVILDVILIQCVGWPIFFLWLWGVPYHRGFFCDDEDLNHPYKPSTVPSWSLYIVGLGLNIFVMTLIEYLNRPNENKEYLFLGMTVPDWVKNIYCTIGIFAFGACCSQLATDVMKYTIGRLRPHFLQGCIPDVCLRGPTPNTFQTNYQCTNPKFTSDARLMKELKLSFPSGHSSFSMYTMLYFAIYLHKRMTWDGSKLLRHTLQYLAVLTALFTAMTRVSDYKHHWSDVLSGLLIGAVTAVITACCFARFWNKKGDDKCTYTSVE